MNESDRFQAAADLFLEAMQLQRDQVETFLDDRCRGNPDLRAEVAALIAASDRPSAFASLARGLKSIHRNLHESPHDPSESPTIDIVSSPSLLSEERAGESIGNYTLIRKLGEGGFGTVWVAQQHRPVQRQVALKIIKVGMDTARIVARFEQERQSLAMMDHPNIAKVFDAGATSSGRPYFVMELCNGEQITRYCDTNSLSIQQRLELFAQVCTAVQHAHTKGIIHRDIKPSNVLVSTQDGKPHAHVIDFGVAKATTARLAEKQVFTEQRQMIGTPEYMSPEQAEGSMDIDTRTDVYSLGVVLYELLTGSTPFSSSELRSAAYAEIQRIIREVDPPKPSTKISQSVDSIANVAARRKTEPRRLGTIIKGELDWIVMKAMEKDRSRRYETPSLLASDILGYLKGAPIAAAPPSASYLASKFVRRHKGTVAAVSAVGLALVAGVIAFAWQASVTSEQRDRALAAEAQSKLRADELQKVSDFQGQMLAQVDPAAAGLRLTRDVKAQFEASIAKSQLSAQERETQAQAFAEYWSRVNATDAALELIHSAILQPATDEIGKRFASQPALDAKLRRAISERYFDLGRYQEAVAQQDLAIETLRKVSGDEHRDTFNAIALKAKILQAQGMLAESETLLRGVVEREAALWGRQDRDTLSAIGVLGETLSLADRLAEAEPLIREALEGHRKVRGDDDEFTIAMMSNLALLLRKQGKLAEAEPLQAEAVERRRRTVGEEHPQTLTAMNNLGDQYFIAGRLKEAKEIFQKTYDTTLRVSGAAHPDTLRTLGNLAATLSRMGDNEGAIALQRGGLEQSRRILGPDHPSSIKMLANLAVSLVSIGNFTEAEPICRETLDRSLRVNGLHHSSTLIAYNVMGFVLQRQDRAAEAEQFLRAALEASAATLGEDHPDRLIFLINYSTLAKSLGKLDEAEQYLAEACERTSRVLGLDHPTTRASFRNYIDLLIQQKRFAECLDVIKRFEPSERKAAEADDGAALARLKKNFGMCNIAIGQFAIAEPALLEAQPVLLKSNPTGKSTIACVQALIDLYTGWDSAEPNKGHDSKAAQWKGALEELSKPQAPGPTP